MRRAEVLDDHEGHPRVGRQSRKQLLKGCQPTGGSANAHDGEFIGFVSLGVRRYW